MLKQHALAVALVFACSAVSAAAPIIDKKNFDTSTEACVDFYQYSNGAWLKANPIPDDLTSWGMFDVLREKSLNDLKGVVEDASAAKAEAGSNLQRIGDFYHSAMDEAAIEKAGVAPLAQEFDAISALSGPADIQAYVARNHQQGGGQLFGFGAFPDFKNASMQIAFTGQGGLGLPDRDYYTREGEADKKLRDRYQKHVARMLELSGVAGDEATSSAKAIVALETQLAKASLSSVELRDPAKSYNIRTLAEASAATPNFDWSAYFAALGLELERFSLAHPKFFAEMGRLLKDESIDTWKAYFRWHAVRGAAPYLSKAFVDESFAFYGQTLRGAKAQRPRWKRVLDVMDTSLGEALGELYVAKHFPPEAKQRAQIMITDLRAALKGRLESLDWMGPETRARALEKLATFTPKVGYPDKWIDYTKLSVDRNASYYENALAAASFEAARQRAKVGQAVDRNEWGMTPQTVNAYYNPLMNEIVFPAAILQAPFFDPNADDAVNYGAIGAVIGHELLHGFDDSGSKFDAKGNMSDWWTADDRKNFEARTKQLSQQYSSYKVEGLNINGDLTLGENIADFGGLTMAYDALKLALERKPAEEIDGLSPQQRFFLAWSQVWRRSQRPEAAKLQINTDPHSPAKYRVIGPFANMPAFAEAFGCKEGDPMIRGEKDRIEIF